jgi:alkaline phosphatase D
MKTGIALLLLAPTFALAQAHPLLQSGPMLGYSEMTEAAIWVQTTRPAKAQIQFRALQSRDRWVTTKPIFTKPEGDHTALFKLTELPFGKKFEYKLLLNGKEIKRNYPLEFQTQPHWRWATNPPVPPNLKIAIGSCSYFSQEGSGFDRPGTPYGGDYEIWNAIHAKRPDMMIWLGDNLYYREPDWLTESAMRYRWRIDRTRPELQAVLASTHHYATWDDHDFGPNDSDSSFRLKETARKVFADYFPAIQYGTPETPGIFQRFEWGDVEFFLLDDRYHRSPNRFPDGPDKVMFGKAQMDWLKKSLVNSDKTFKIIASGNQLIQPRQAFERFGNFAAEQKDLFDFIATAGINGVMFLSGDRHHTELLKVTWPGAKYPWLEYTSSPLNSGAGLRPNERDNPARVPGTFVENLRNFGLIEVSGPWRDRKLTLTAHDKNGKELWRHEVKEAELRPSGN